VTLERKYNRTPLIRTLVIPIADYSDRLGPSDLCVDNSTNYLALKLAVIESSMLEC